MADQTEREVLIRDLLAAHRLIGGRCRCGMDPRLDYFRYESHVADAILAAGFRREHTPRELEDAVAAERAATVAWLTTYRDLAPGISGLIDDIRLGIHRIDPNEPPGEGVNP